MADLNQFVHPHGAFYESIYQRLDPAGTGIVSAGPIVELLKTSGLPTQLLGLIWEEADYTKRGHLDRKGVFIALKLVAAAQAGHAPSSASLSLQLGPPSLSGFAPPPMGGHSPQAPQGISGWGINPTDQAKYDAIFDSLGPENGKLPGGKVRPVLLNSGLNATVLAKIWELADQDKDGFLDRVEMNVALHLVYRALQGESVPRSLPDHLIHPTKSMLSRRNSVASASGTIRSRTGSVTSLNELSQYTPTHGASVPPGIRPYSVQAAPPRPPSLTPQHTGSVGLNNQVTSSSSTNWPVNVSDYAEHFATLDTDRDGLVRGMDCSSFFISTGLPQHILAHVWSLVDMNSTGALSLEQFSLALYLISRMTSYGEELPSTLPSHLIPPSLRTPSQSNQPSEPTTPLEDDDEAMALVADISRLEDDRKKAEEEMIQLEGTMKAKQNTMKQLQVELKTLEGTVKQLEKQKAEANRRLGEMDEQKNRLLAAVEGHKAKAAETQKRMENVMKESERASASREEDTAKMTSLREEVIKLERDASAAEGELRSELHSLEGTVGELSRLEREATSLEKQKEKAERINGQIESTINELDTSLSNGTHCSALMDDFSRFSLIDTPSTSYSIKNNPSDVFGHDESSHPQSSSTSYGMKGPPPRPAPPSTKKNTVDDPFANADPFSGSDQPAFGSNGGSAAFADFANFGQFG